MNVQKVAQVPAPAVAVTATVLDAVRVMERVRGGAVVVLEGDRLAGILSERDIMLRVVGAGRDARTTPVTAVMTTPVETIETDAPVGEALEAMVAKHIRHLPVVSADGRVRGLVSIRNVLHSQVEYLADQMNSLEAFVSADGPGG